MTYSTAEISLVSAQTETTTRPLWRWASIDAYRGFVMLLIFAEILRTCALSAALPDSILWKATCQQQTHAVWVGCSLHDLIQPSFYFLVGLSIVLSMRRRLTTRPMSSVGRQVFVRSLTLVILGMTLIAVQRNGWIWRFDETLSQIGLAYPFAFFVARRPKREWPVVFFVIVIVYWIWFALFPLPGADFDYPAHAVSTDWLRVHGLSGFAAHWQKNSNAASELDRQLLTLFPNNAAEISHPLGLTTFNFIPCISIMVLGVIAASVLEKKGSKSGKVVPLALAGGSLVVIGLSLGALGVCPVVKSIWTPSWVLFSGGCCVLLLCGFHILVDVAGFRRLAFPLRVIGLNSLIAYCLARLYPAVAFNSLRRVFGADVFLALGSAYEPLVYGAAVITAYWACLFVLYRAKIFVRL